MSLFDNISQLRTLITIVECGSISAAAQRLNSTQPTLSRHLSALESKAGTTLIQRDTHRMHLTHAGHQVLADARAIIGLVEESENRLRDEQTQLKGHIRVFATIDFGQSVVSRMVASFIEAHPNVSIDLSYSNRPVHMIEEGQDVGVVAGRITDDSIVAKNVGCIQRSIVASPNFLRGKKIEGLKDMESLPWVTLKQSQFDSTANMKLYNKKLPAENISVSSVLTTEGVTSIRETVRMGLGIAILPTWLVKEDLLSKRLVPVLPDWRPEDIPAHVVYPSQRMLPNRLRRFINYSAEYMATCLQTDL